MKIEIFDSHCSQLNRIVKIALDVEAEDPYRNSFKTVFDVPMELRFLLESRTGVDLFVDVGANIGHFTLSTCLIGIPTVAIEALADNYLLLAKSLAANSVRNVIPFHMAASDGFFPVTLQSYGAWANVSHSGSGDTPALPLDQLLVMLKLAPPDLIKIDVEGHEIPVLRGLTETLKESRPMLIFEGNNWTARTSGGYAKLLEEVASRNYDLFLFNKDGTMHPVSASGLQDVVCVDYFAYPRDAVRSRSRPKVRIPTLDEKISRIEADIDAGEPHRWHISTIIDRFEAENGRSARLDLVREKLTRAARDQIETSLANTGASET
jgi:FkbM family methyltransferase